MNQIKFTIKNSSIHGQGVFPIDELEKDEFIGEHIKL